VIEEYAWEGLLAGLLNPCNVRTETMNQDPVVDAECGCPPGILEPHVNNESAANTRSLNEFLCLLLRLGGECRT